jgi:non-lysosomal glucosylceramidase
MTEFVQQQGAVMEKIYQGSKMKEINFPLGGIGTGCIGLAGNGQLQDWEIFNRPNKGSLNGNSLFAVKAECDGRLLDARMLQSDLPPPYMGIYKNEPYSGFGHGPDRYTMAGMPHFEDAVFHGSYPIARLLFGDSTFPGRVALRAFNPFIPGNDRDSGIPAAFFEVEAINTTEKPLVYTFCLAVTNPFVENGGVNAYTENHSLKTIRLAQDALPVDDPAYGDITIATDAVDVSYQAIWYRGGWFDDLAVFWKDFTASSRLPERTCSYPQKGHRDTACLATHVLTAPGETGRTRFVISWSFPNCVNYWREADYTQGASVDGKRKVWKNYYATVFPDSGASAAYAFEHWDTLQADTKMFHEALISSTLPECVIDAVSANISILKSPTCLRLEDGSFYGWEGCHCHEGSCEGSCTHVWNYAYALPFLFPSLERSMRTLNYRYNQRESGAMSFRLRLPLGVAPGTFRPCCDGQFGDVIKTYRDWKISGDSVWLRSLWPAIKKSIAFAWSSENPDRWDANRDGVLEGRQHHTLDMELFGPNAWMEGFYLAALKAGAEMARVMGEPDTAEKYMRLFTRGKDFTDRHLFNGEYYQQKIDLKDEHVLDPYLDSVSLFGGGTRETYWNEEAKELKYQIGEGCAIDQLLGQWHANLCSLGEIFDPAQTRKALASIYRHNFKHGFRRYFNPGRIYSLNSESGAVICEWPEGKLRPVIAAPYCEETWSGCEYQVAAHMVQEGLVQEGIELVAAVRNRYDGEKRNPFNEMECGSNYARSMASYSLLLAFSGFSYDMTKGEIGFTPVCLENGKFACFWSLEGAWGVFKLTEGRALLHVLYGRLPAVRLNVTVQGRTSSVYSQGPVSQGGELTALL